MALLSVQQIAMAGAQITFNACAGGGDSFVNSGSVIIFIKNDDASSKTVTLAGTGPDNFGLTGSFLNLAIVVPAGQIWKGGPFPPNRFNDANNQVQLTYSAVTSLTIAILAA